jgi:DinB superfamily
MCSNPAVKPVWAACVRTAAVAALVLVAVGRSPVAAALTELERQRLVAHLEMTAGWLVDEVSGLTTAQIEFRRAPNAWTIAQVVDHLVVVAPIYWRDLQTALKQPPTDRPTWMTDADVLWYGIDRTRREQAVPTERPTGEFRDLRASLEAYRTSHDRLLKYVKTTRDDLRSHIVQRQGCDAYQWALMISTHEQRHVLQIREIKADPKFPKK